MKPSWTVASADGCELAGYELGGRGDDVLLIAHATGLCGAMYQLLADELTDTFRVVAFDFRGHGDSTRSGEGPIWAGTAWPRTWSPSLDTWVANACTASATRWAAGRCSWPSGRCPACSSRSSCSSPSRSRMMSPPTART